MKPNRPVNPSPRAITADSPAFLEGSDNTQTQPQQIRSLLTEELLKAGPLFKLNAFQPIQATQNLGKNRQAKRPQALKMTLEDIDESESDEYQSDDEDKSVSPDMFSVFRLEEDDNPVENPCSRKRR